MEANNGIWHDPIDWVVRLNDKLAALDIQYHGIKQIQRMRFDPDETQNTELIDGDPQANATLTATAMLAAVVAALKEIPTFQGNVGLTGLTDLGHALRDLDRGLRPVMLQPRPGVTSPGDGSGRQFLKAHVVLCVELLEIAGLTNSAARKAIAKIFADNGFRGRKGGREGNPLSPQTVYDWSIAMAQHGADRDGRGIIDRAIAEWKSRRPWPPVEADVLRFASDCAADPALQTKG
ncbi:hypothetical protein [Sphingomonas yabuuchiae]|uniref:hypothetical protein n=1 Tax=Sphingomonas yabuuchiae TaxID=172044 RepID=UPI003D9987A0